MILKGTQNVIDAEVQSFSKAQTRVDTYMNYTRPPLAIGLDPIRKAFLHSKDRGIHLRYITEITKENLSYCKELIKIVDEMRHLDAIKGNFMVSESEYVGPLILFEHGKIATQAVYSNISEVIEQQQYLFDNFWNQAISAEERIKEIEEGVIPVRTRLLENRVEIIKQLKHFVAVVGLVHLVFSCLSYSIIIKTCMISFLIQSTCELATKTKIGNYSCDLSSINSANYIRYF